jgi:tight adherence protein C
VDAAHRRERTVVSEPLGIAAFVWEAVGAVLFVLLLVRIVWRHRPAPARARRLVQVEREGLFLDLRLATIGRAARRMIPVEVPGDDERLGKAVVVGVVATLWSPLGFGPSLVSLPIGVVAGLVAWWRPTLQERRRLRRHAVEVVVGLPELIDLLAVAIAAGLTVPQAATAVGTRLRGPNGAALHEVSRRLSLGTPRAEALDLLVVELGEPVRPLVAALQGADRYGIPLGPTLQRLGDEARARRRRRAEAHARRIPVRLLFPLVLCTLPAFALLTVIPLLAGSLSSLSPSTPSVDRSPPCCTSTSSSVPR